jgi:hypothetical protein
VERSIVTMLRVLPRIVLIGVDVGPRRMMTKKEGELAESLALIVA